MKNLIPLTRKMRYWDDIVNNKNTASRISLQAIRQDVSSRFTAYINRTNPNSLENIPASPFVNPNFDLLKSCYSKSKGLSNLKTKIKEQQPYLLRSECQYCNIGEPGTFDHYLPKETFPEFSALSINLIPCCPICNYKKGEEWIHAGTRKIINFYYDQLPTSSYLQCAITYRNNIPLADFSLNTTMVNANIRTIISEHFSTLNLIDRYNQRSNSEITDIRNAIIQSVGLLSRAQIQAQLNGEAANMKASKGDNYWRAVLRIALAHSNRFLNEVGY